jgi:hypothetical protein
MTSVLWYGRSIRVGLLTGFICVLSQAPVRAWELGEPTLELLNRTIVQDQGHWQIDYRLRYEGAAGLIVTMEDIVARVEGWVSNSRAAGHATPRLSSLTVTGPSRLQAQSDVISSEDEEARCRERAALKIWVEPAPGIRAGRVLETAREGDTRPEASAAVLSLAPGMTLRVQLRLEHQHVVYGPYDPLLGRRSLEICLGAARFQDVLPLDHEQYVAQPPRARFELTEEHRDTHYYRSAPDSLHVAAHIPGNAYYRFAEIPVRYSTKMRLRFCYLIASGTEGRCRARVTQYKDSPIAWKVLSEGRRDATLSTVGRWTQVEMIFRTEPKATTLAIDFRIEGEDVEVGEFWIDDLSLEPLKAQSLDP